MENISIRHLGDLKLMYVQASSFPDGIQDAWDKLEKTLDTMKGRKFYGTSHYENGKMIYRACVIPVDDAEVLKLGLKTFTVPPGEYAAAKLMNWSSQIQKIREIFTELNNNYSANPDLPNIEFYKSSKELILMLPILDTPQTKS